MRSNGEFDDVCPEVLCRGSLGWIGERSDNLHVLRTLVPMIKKDAPFLCLTRQALHAVAPKER